MKTSVLIATSTQAGGEKQFPQTCKKADRLHRAAFIKGRGRHAGVGEMDY